MDTQTDRPPPPPPPGRARPRIERATEPRVVAGVCEGLGRAFDVDPIIFRVAFPVLVLAGGSGLFLYLLAWVLIPEEGKRTSLVEDALGRGDSTTGTASWLPIVALVLAGFLLVVSLGESGPPLNLAALAVVGVIAYLMWQVRTPPSGGPPDEAPPRAAGPETASEAPTRGVGPTHATAAWSGTGSTAATPAPAPRQRPPLARLTLSLLVIGAGVALALDAATDVGVSLQAYLAGAILVVGSALVAGAFVGRPRGLVALGTVLTVAFLVVSAADAPMSDGSGARRWRPTSADELRSSYRLGAGDALLDLSEVELDPGTTELEVRVGAGELRVVVPEDVTVEVDARTGVGVLDVLGREEAGFDARSRRTQRSDPSSPTLDLDARVGFGSMEVTRDAS